MRLIAGPPGHERDGAFWRAVRALYDEAFPGLPAAIARAERAGWSWPDVTTPFALFEGERCVAHVGVLSHPMRLAGREVTIAGVHAVCTARDHRSQGLCRELLSHALAWVDERAGLAKLHTDLPRVYEAHGFATVPSWRFRSRVEPAPNVARRRLRPSEDPADAALLRRLLASRAPASARCATADPGFMVGIVAALTARLDSALWWLPEHEAIVALDEGEGATVVTEVIAPALPSAAVIAGAASDPARPRLYAFAPDLVEPDAEPEPAPASLGAFMVRGDWPVAEPFGISPLWEH
jgi:GNAT superfamily N-acetyltransferase